MVEELEVPLEKVQEDLHHNAEESQDSWTLGVALSSAFLAALAAVAALLAGHHANEAMIEQIHASDHWGYFQAKGIKSAVLATKVELLRSMGKATEAKDEEKLEEYKKEQAEIKADAEKEEAASRAHMASHQILARAVTMFQVAIAVGAISALTRRRRFWYASLVFGLLGAAFLAQGLLT
jgi:hypothetical protein